MENKESIIGIRVTKEQHVRLEKLAKELRVTKSEIIRRLIKAALDNIK